MLTRAQYQLIMTDGALSPIGQPLDDWTQLDIVQRAGYVGTISVQAPATPKLLEMSQPGCRLVVLRDVGAGWEYLVGGPIEHDDDFDWKAGAGPAADPGTTTLYFADDTAAIADRIIYPTPANSSQAQTATARYTRTGVAAGTIMCDLVRLNAGVDALAYRDTGVTIGAGVGVGSAVNASIRFVDMLDALRSLASAGGGLGFRVVQVAGPALEFQVYVPADRSGDVRYSRDLGNLQAISYRHQAPSASVAIVGGDGTGTSRLVREYPSLGATPAPWGRREMFVSASSDDATELAQAGEQALTQAGEQVTLSVVAVDTPTQRYGVQYGLGDIVGVEVRPGLLVTAPVTQVTIKVDKAGELVTPTIGSGNPVTQPRQVAELRDLQRRLAIQERG
jgi:hypothetical protein